MRPRKGTKTGLIYFIKNKIEEIYKDETPEGDENFLKLLNISAIQSIYKDETPEGDENMIFF